MLFLKEPSQRLKIHRGDILVAKLFQIGLKLIALIQPIRQPLEIVLAKPELTAGHQIAAELPLHTLLNGRRQTVTPHHPVDVASSPYVNRGRFCRATQIAGEIAGLRGLANRPFTPAVSHSHLSIAAVHAVLLELTRLWVLHLTPNQLLGREVRHAALIVLGKLNLRIELAAPEALLSLDGIAIVLINSCVRARGTE